ncbi:hypothetical protein P171DRAFT_106385 [Karstenula rhodostoma CBS 690.94]|uniref:Uncharacterized protein n=1 Tax=Karstenula rhodostoma CBS 690.94 TaxID=1392251 RepID=A0A9P4PCK8_9PLEO|nr:hypothetical protein P171DRAFT_106385 [Karstenula rhodostoma CBS 690.94]
MCTCILHKPTNGDPWPTCPPVSLLQVPLKSHSRRLRCPPPSAEPPRTGQTPSSYPSSGPEASQFNKVVHARVQQHSHVGRAAKAAVCTPR